MPDAKAKFFRILLIEIEDLIDTISILVESHKKRKESGEITEYVYRENVAVLSAEKTALGNFLEELAGFDVPACAGVPELAKGIEERFVAFLDEHDYSPALGAFVRKKILKVLDYCRCEHE